MRFDVLDRQPLGEAVPAPVLALALKSGVVERFAVVSTGRSSWDWSAKAGEVSRTCCLSIFRSAVVREVKEEGNEYATRRRENFEERARQHQEDALVVSEAGRACLVLFLEFA